MPNALLTRRTMLTGLAAALSLNATRAQAASPFPARPMETSQWGELEFVDAADRAFRLAETSRKLTLIHLWANWCPICMDELRLVGDAMPGLQHRGIAVLLVSSPLDWDADLRIAASHALGAQVARPSGRNAPGAIRSALFDADGWYYVPRSVLYDHARRRVVWSHLGRLDWRRAAWSGDLPSAGV